MKTLAILLGTALGAASLSASATDIYKYVSRDGSVLYTQSALKNQKPSKILRVAPATAKGRANERTARRELERLQVRTDQLAMMSAMRDLADNPSCAAPASAATNNMASVLTPLPGERIGTAGGYSRLSESYWDRVRSTLGTTSVGAGATGTSAGGAY